MTPRTRLVHGPIDAGRLIAEVGRPANGAILLFLGVVRDVNDGRPVSGIEYTAYEAMAELELAAIATEASTKFGSDDLAIEHRLGDLSLQDVSVGIAVAHPHRGIAYDTSRWIIEALKQRVPIWKRERYVDGTREWVDPSGRSRMEAVSP